MIDMYYELHKARTTELIQSQIQELKDTLVSLESKDTFQHKGSSLGMFRFQRVEGNLRFLHQKLTGYKPKRNQKKTKLSSILPDEG